MNGYDFLYRLGVAVAALFWLLKAKTRQKVLSAFGERMGRGIPQQRDGAVLWIHAVSLGEINATRALVDALERARPGLRIAISTTTSTGHDRARELYADKPNFTLLRFPLDFSSAINRALDALHPSLVVLMELEVWPNFMRQCARRDVPVMVINARLTPHSWKRYRLIKPIARTMFGRLAAVAAQEQSYAEQFIALGVPKERVAVTGTMKFDTATVAATVPGADELARDLQLSADEVLWVAGSTGPGEEAIILSAYQSLLQQFPSLRLAIIPRHPARFDEVADLIQRQKFPLIRRSTGGAFSGGEAEACSSAQRLPSLPVILGDTMGELRKFYSLATVVVVGRTLLDLGPRQRGSDMIEPAALARPTIVGPWTQNFAEPMNAFRVASAMIELSSPAAEVAPAVAGVLSDAARAQSLGLRAQQVVRSQQGATSRNIEVILAHL